MTWAQVGQVDLFWTKIGGKYLMLGLKIEIKIIGNGGKYLMLGLKIEIKIIGNGLLVERTG